MFKSIARGIDRSLTIYVERFPIAFKAEIALLGLGHHGARFTSDNGGEVLGQNQIGFSRNSVVTTACTTKDTGKMQLRNRQYATVSGK